jgi:putative SOS response-associated peptidase YedK
MRRPTPRQPRREAALVIACLDGQPIAFAGLWEASEWPDETINRTFAIITTTACGDVTGMHGRPPAILAQSGWSAWLGEAEGDPVVLLRPAPAPPLRYWPVSRKLNTPRTTWRTPAGAGDVFCRRRRTRWLLRMDSGPSAARDADRNSRLPDFPEDMTVMET